MRWYANYQLEDKPLVQGFINKADVRFGFQWGIKIVLYLIDLSWWISCLSVSLQSIGFVTCTCHAVNILTSLVGVKFTFGSVR